MIATVTGPSRLTVLHPEDRRIERADVEPEQQLHQDRHRPEEPDVSPTHRASTGLADSRNAASRVPRAKPSTMTSDGQPEGEPEAAQHRGRGEVVTDDVPLERLVAGDGVDGEPEQDQDDAGGGPLAGAASAGRCGEGTASSGAATLARVCEDMRRLRDSVESNTGGAFTQVTQNTRTPRGRRTACTAEPLSRAVHREYGCVSPRCQGCPHCEPYVSRQLTPNRMPVPLALMHPQQWLVKRSHIDFGRVWSSSC